MFGAARTDRSVFASEQTPRHAVTFYYSPPLSRAVFIHLQRLRLRLGSGIHHNLPAYAGWICRDSERHLVVRGIQENEERVIRFLLATLGQVHEPGLAAEPHRERLRLRVSPVRFRHLCTVRAQPDDVLDLGAGDGLAEEEPVAVENNMCAPKQDELADEGEQRRSFVTHALPVEPADFVILAVGVAVAALASAELVAAEQHWHPLREEQRRQEIAHLPLAEP